MTIAPIRRTVRTKAPPGKAFALFTGIAANPQFPGAPFLVAAALLGAGAVLVVTGSRKREAPHPTT